MKRRGGANVRDVNHRAIGKEQDAALQGVGRDVVRGAKDLVDLLVDEDALGEKEDFEIERIEPIATNAVRRNHATLPRTQDPKTDFIQYRTNTSIIADRPVVKDRSQCAGGEQSPKRWGTGMRCRRPQSTSHDLPAFRPAGHGRFRFLQQPADRFL